MHAGTAQCAGRGHFEHEAILYRGRLDGFVRALAPEIEATLRAGGSVVVAAPADRVERLRARFGTDERLSLIDLTGPGVNPACIIPLWRGLADAALAAPGPFLGIGEPAWQGRSDRELDEVHRHEALVNLAFSDDPHWRLLCPYDVDGLAPATVAGASLTHPVVAEGDERSDHRVVDVPAVLDALDAPLTAPPQYALSMPFDIRELVHMRAFVRAEANRAGLRAARSADLELAVTEMATNSIRHGGGSGELIVWHDAGAVHCQTTDAGEITDPLVGRRRPADPLATDGRGVWILNQLSSLSQIRTGPSGTVVRIEMR